MRELKRIPKLNDFCQVNYDGRVCKANVVNVNSEEQTFDVKTSFKADMYNIPFEKFNYKEPYSISNHILMEMDKIKGLDKALKAGREKKLKELEGVSPIIGIQKLINEAKVEAKMQFILNQANKLINP